MDGLDVHDHDASPLPTTVVDSSTTMPTFSDGGHPYSDDAMADYDTPSLAATGDIRLHLQNILDNKEKQLQQAGTLGQQLLTQRMELEERIRQLQEYDLDGVSGEDDMDVNVRDKYRELADTLKAWDAENDQLSNLFGSKVRCITGLRRCGSLTSRLSRQMASMHPPPLVIRNRWTGPKPMPSALLLLNRHVAPRMRHIAQMTSVCGLVFLLHTHAPRCRDILRCRLRETGHGEVGSRLLGGFLVRNHH